MSGSNLFQILQQLLILCEVPKEHFQSDAGQRRVVRHRHLERGIGEITSFDVFIGKDQEDEYLHHKDSQSKATYNLY